MGSIIYIKATQMANLLDKTYIIKPYLVYILYITYISEPLGLYKFLLCFMDSFQQEPIMLEFTRSSDIITYA